MSTHWRKHRSDGAGCHPKDVEAAREHAKRSGCAGVDFTPDGQATFSSANAKRRYLKQIGMHNRDDNV